MLEYWKNEDETNKVIFVDSDGTRWLRTGDLGYINKDGFVYYRGRIKRIYTTAGIDGTTINKIFPQRIEECLESYQIVEQCGVIVVPDAVRVNVPIAYVLLKKGINETDVESSLRDLIEKELPDHLWPKTIHFLNAMPMTPSGKIDYRALEKLTETGQ